MLLRLIVRDFVIVDRIELEFGGGFGALTGETGAGKSILVDALSLALGERADATVVRSGAERAEISAEFDVASGSALESWLRAGDFDTDACLLRRVIDNAGRSRAYVNGTAATLGQLREVADFLADIHGQNAHHSLLRADAQRDLLDIHAGAQTLAREVAAAWTAWRAAREARAEAEKDVEAAARERELLEWQVGELAALGFDAAGWQETEQERRRLGNANALLEGAGMALTALEEGDAASLPMLQHAGAKLAELTSFDPALGEAAQLFEGALIQLEESALALRRYQDRLELDPARLAELDSRIDAVTQMARKHRVAPEELPALLESLQSRLAELSLRADPAALAERERKAEAAFREVAKKLSALRAKTAKSLSAAVTAGMQDLAMAGGRFEVALTPLPAGAASGLENIEFQVSANAGQPLRGAGQGGLGRRVVAHRPGPAGHRQPGQCRRHADLRRSRCRHRRPRRGNRRPHVARTGQEPPGAVRHPPAAGGGAGRLAMVDRQGNAQGGNDVDGQRPRPRGAHRRDRAHAGRRKNHRNHAPPCGGNARPGLARVSREFRMLRAWSPRRWR
jgi:DNA repair protein RecN (Recombination protein N)